MTQLFSHIYKLETNKAVNYSRDLTDMLGEQMTHYIKYLVNKSALAFAFCVSAVA